ncbi:hypothetical protein NDU88_004876 [Pleurodeles waltl]|uniref:Uncharacterized protein n=1 Tax=Pleurodeles waltl TaxID=8319 RepID=A0AAV7V4T5_PLEWA|nr:hypothetical protein NDU88_004876 [Pleurodeles waltl]
MDSYKPFIHHRRKELGSPPYNNAGNNEEPGCRGLRCHEETTSGYSEEDNLFQSPKVIRPPLHPSYSEENRSCYISSTASSVDQGTTAVCTSLPHTAYFQSCLQIPTPEPGSATEEKQSKPLDIIIDRTSTFNSNAAEKLEVFLTQKARAMNASPSNLNCYKFNIHGRDHEIRMPPVHGIPYSLDESQTASTLHCPDRSKSLEMIRQAKDHTNRIPLMQSHFESHVQFTSQQDSEHARDISKQLEMAHSRVSTQAPLYNKDTTSCSNSNWQRNTFSEDSCVSHEQDGMGGHGNCESPLDCVLSKSVFPPNVPALNNVAYSGLHDPLLEQIQFGIKKTHPESRQLKEWNNVSETNFNQGNSNCPIHDVANKPQEKMYEEEGCSSASAHQEEHHELSHVQRWVGKYYSDELLGSDDNSWVSPTSGGVRVSNSSHSTWDQGDHSQGRDSCECDKCRRHHQAIEGSIENHSILGCKHHEPSQSWLTQSPLEDHGPIKGSTLPQVGKYMFLKHI